MATCKACGDAIDFNRLALMHQDGEKIVDGEFSYCRECADELFRGKISMRRAKLYSIGRGCPLEPSSDASPGQENAIRNMEEG